MDRRHFLQLVSTLAASGPLLSCAQSQENLGQGVRTLPKEAWQEIEAGAQGRLGVAVLDSGTGQLQGHRLDERFPMCSTFKWLAGAYVLQRVDAGEERLDRRIRYGRDVLLPHSPITEKHVGGDGMTLAGLCEATITLSDNAAANLILQTFGGPQGLTRYVRTLGDGVTRLDRTEPELNEGTPGDPRDTTTPRAMAQLLRTVMLGDALSARSRAQLVQWMQDCKTNGKRLGAHLPAGWKVGSKTGTGARGTTNDVGVYWPPGRAPIVVAAYLTEAAAAEDARNGAIARVAKRVTTA
ncbi:class A beta-lactamase [Schlegelella sp. S2-27]|uniref:Beta-lactamase n=2 Tax=Caldimonas mangrovi TaxID=2944811 RepID=A0ABT0YWS7_9BURK|nr:class A beta-lactamase [Caldimonas mangrovi]MCM5682804.1 class A beta-lactamase [Caldimonas mangrovi]